MKTIMYDGHKNMTQEAEGMNRSIIHSAPGDVVYLSVSGEPEYGTATTRTI
jgi:hypothetical protein